MIVWMYKLSLMPDTENGEERKMTDLKDYLKAQFSEAERAEIQRVADELILATGLQLLREKLL